MTSSVLKKTVFNRKPAKQGDDYHFSIPRELIEKGIIDPTKFYEIWVYEFNLDK